MPALMPINRATGSIFLPSPPDSTTTSVVVVSNALDFVSIIKLEETEPTRVDSWFWTQEWQQKEEEASRQLEAGFGFGPFNSVEEMRSHFVEWKKRKNTAQEGSPSSSELL